MAVWGPFASRRHVSQARGAPGPAQAPGRFRPGGTGGGLMTDILRKTAHAWLPAVLTIAVVGIGITVATW